MRSFRLHCPFPYRSVPAACVLALWILLLAGPVSADVLYVYDVRSTELLMGEKQSELKIGYAPTLMVMDTKVRFTGGWMQRLFGEVKEERSTTLLVLDREQVREVDWENWGLSVIPLGKLRDVSWVREQTSPPAEGDESLAGRYQAVEPELSVVRHPEPEAVDGYSCHRVEAKLRLETRDTRRNASSVTHVRQELWLTEKIPGFEERQQAHRELTSRLGLESERIGSLSFLLRYWRGPLEPIDELVGRARGVFVKSVLSVDAEYTTGVDSAGAKTVGRRLKEETIRLRAVQTGPLDRSLFDAPPHFRTVELD